MEWKGKGTYSGTLEYILRTISANDVGANVDMSPGLGLAHSKRAKIPISWRYLEAIKRQAHCWD